MKQSILRSKILAGLAGLGTLFAAGTAGAADWLKVQGTEPEGSADLARVWGFVQAQYQKDTSDPNPAGGYIPPKLIGPNLDTQSAFNVNRARIGVRGVAMPLDSKINYFLLLEMGNNGITAPGNSFAKATDASITFNHLKGARVRAGLFKYPGAEEGLQAIHVFDYINFTWVTGQMLLERFPNRTYTPNIPPQTLPPGTALNGFEESVGAFRDVGVQVFDTFNFDGNWEASYAVMIGNGNGLNFSDNNNDKDVYLYGAVEKVFGGQGPRRQGLKLFAWTHNGTRTADLTNDGVHNPEDYDRDRYGIGAKYLRNGLRVTAEYMKGEGMIWQAPHNPSFGLGPGAGNPTAPGNGAFAEANGYYIEGGYRLPGTKWELDARYDVYNRLDGDRFEIKFERVTLGVQYFFNPRVRVAVNYEMRSGEAPNFPAGAGPNANVDGIDDRIAVQVTGIWSQ
jgi:hypothetical protein